MVWDRFSRRHPSDSVQSSWGRRGSDLATFRLFSQSWTFPGRRKSSGLNWSPCLRPKSQSENLHELYFGRYPVSRRKIHLPPLVLLPSGLYRPDGSRSPGE